ncbi:bifunctional 4-hydroxy-2-oxoglutarate aldolase/2-dehydro-3-deoxy-phosphogluconate aldolase [Solitalea koreensis]|uniref:2-dehydro-3-deoxyphosphogluconate aldolase / (4S)-4-hydroxy-2-oxoglutarate aldolase n=1 Tax=Solitalea koreensis TaxID=543615 RepID=A0A521CL00_9SPHI|nr:bifunctional 4-hydroxy-2-oxoglutarate aldolase/2-dehydro-3-deoxy-phosphogluconate aldolase [Solitalea koreensis]SMO60108.1 2-dehydro-3-deoxyphosphogluconate aldolase / (4S)-4-hydroxy-2-oxoglutarate aldolase [Solitalea koreensis]
MKTHEMQQDTVQELTKSKVLPLFYHEGIEVCKGLLTACYNGGVKAVEFTNRGKNALENFALLRTFALEHFPDMIIGVGTIKNRAEAECFWKAGAAFIVSPALDEETGVFCLEKELLWIPGCMTPSEINKAVQLGCSLIKLFPANVLGAGFSKAMKDIFPDTKFIVTGGIDAKLIDIEKWVNNNVIAVGLGSSLIKNDWIADKRFDEITRTLREICIQ